MHSDKKMKLLRLGIDMRMMKPFPTGIGSHYINLTHELIKNFPDREYVLIVNSRCETYIKEHFADIVDASITYVMIDINGGSFKQQLATLSLITKYKALHLDLLLTDIWSSFAGIPVRYIVMVYDLIGFHNVMKVSVKQKLYDMFLYRYIVRHATHLIASVEFVKTDIMKFFHIAENTITVVMPSVYKEYTETLTDAFVQEIQHTYELSGRYIVYIGNRREHKNIHGALKIFETLLRNRTYHNVSFVLIGGYDTEQSQNEENFVDMIAQTYPAIKDNVKILGRIMSNRDVAAILKGAVCLFHPTLFEGYGITPLEAMNAGTPVVGTNHEAVSQVVEDAGLLADPKDIQKHVANLQIFLNNATIRDEYIAKGKKRASEISWKKAASTLNKAIEKLQ